MTTRKSTKQKAEAKPDIYTLVSKTTRRAMLRATVSDAYQDLLDLKVPLDAPESAVQVQAVIEAHAHGFVRFGGLE